MSFFLSLFLSFSAIVVVCHFAAAVAVAAVDAGVTDVAPSVGSIKCYRSESRR